MNLKKIWIFYVLIFAPLIILFFLAGKNEINSTVFVSLLFVYALIYHPAISGLRLAQSGKIPASKFWYNFIPGWNGKYIWFLFFNRQQ